MQQPHREARKRQFIHLSAGLILALLLTPAWGLDLRATRTQAELIPGDARTPVIDLDFKARLRGVGNLIGVDVVATWKNAGGVEPTPFKVLIPAGCFVPARRSGTFRVADFGRCGVEITTALGGVILPMSIVDFGARIIVDSEGNGRLDLGALFGSTPDDGAPVLGALGGAVVEIVIGAESASSLPLGVESVSGIEPVPF